MAESGRIKLLYVLGTRPEAVKLAPLINLSSADSRFATRVLSSGQHMEMLKPVLDLFDVRVDYDLALMQPGQTLLALTARIMAGLVQPIETEKPDWLIVQGDTSTCMAGACAGFLSKVPVAHVEAGLRTGDLYSPWPEEFNRRVAAIPAAKHFAPTQHAAKNLITEGYAAQDIFVTGNTGIDAQILALAKLDSRADLRAQVERRFACLDPSKRLLLVTVHRREAHGAPLRGILRALKAVVEQRSDVEIALPVHKNPEVARAVVEILGTSGPRVHLFEPLDYISFLYVMRRSTLILTDSGGVQEEAPTLKKPVLILREATERMEAVAAGCAKLVGFDEQKIIGSTLELLDNPELARAMTAGANPFGDGQAARKILEIFARASARKAS